MKTFLYYASFIFLLISCHTYPKNVEEALSLSGDKRTDWEKVLEHFRSQGDIPYKSACFLIENMIYHQTRQQIILDSTYFEYFKSVDSIYNFIFSGMTVDEIRHYRKTDYDSIRIKMAERFNALKKADIKYVDKTDLQTIDTDFLIDNIECALEIWRGKGYKTNEDFEFFKEFILPYRTTDEYPLLKRSQIQRMYGKILMNSSYTSIEEAIDCYNIYVGKCRWISRLVTPGDKLGLFDLFVPRSKMDCHTMTNWHCNVMRACGLPAVYEFTPKWIHNDSRHFWSCSPDSMGIYQPYSAPGSNFHDDWEGQIKNAGKVYRRTFGAQKDTPYFIAGEDEYIPDIFQTPLLSDQTFRYRQTVTLRLPLKYETKSKVVYLCMFTHAGLIPVGWGTINQAKKELIFEQLPLNILFFPVCYDEETMIEIAEPFMLLSSENINCIPNPITTNYLPEKVMELSLIEKGLYDATDKRQPVSSIHYVTLTCDTIRKSTLRLLRKFPQKKHLQLHLQEIKGAYMLGSNKERGPYDTLYVLNHTPYPYLQEIQLNNSKSYRYYRFLHPGRHSVNIAHMEFLGKHSRKHKCSLPTSLPIFSEENKENYSERKLYRINGIPLQTSDNASNAFDGNWETYVTTSSVGMDFGTPVCISGFRFLPRTANNGIVRGNSYALYYYDHEWKEFEVLYADRNVLEFDSVPVSTLYWLKNLTTGNEELPFFYNKGKQYFLHTDNLPLQDYE